MFGWQTTISALLYFQFAPNTARLSPMLGTPIPRSIGNFDEVHQSDNRSYINARDDVVCQLVRYQRQELETQFVGVAYLRGIYLRGRGSRGGGERLSQPMADISRPELCMASPWKRQMT